jgi:hypothetical protein
MVQGFDISLTRRQAELVEYALRAHIKELTELADCAHVRGDDELALQCESSANVVRNTLAQVKDGLYGLFLKQEAI